MLAFLLRRLALVVPTFLGITLIAFSLIHLIPGDPVQVMAGERRLDPVFHAETLARLGLDRPLWEQYLAYLWKALHLNLGQSFVTHESVWSEFGKLFPATLELSVCALGFATVLGLLAGVLAAIKRGSWLDHGVMGLSLTGFSMPIFWWGLLLIMFFSVGMREWAPEFALPVSGRLALEYDIAPRTGFMLVDTWLAGEPGAFRSALAHLVLPSIVLGTIPLAVIARMTRSAMLEVLREDYVRTALAKGLPQRLMITRHALRNALIPAVTVIGYTLGGLLGGAVVTETVFNIPGMGRLVVQSIQRRDFPVIQGAVMMIAGFYVLANLLVDVLYVYIDPRVRYGGD